jgi:hypothetical protein
MLELLLAEPAAIGQAGPLVGPLAPAVGGRPPPHDHWISGSAVLGHG